MTFIILSFNNWFFLGLYIWFIRSLSFWSTFPLSWRLSNFENFSLLHFSFLFVLNLSRCCFRKIRLLFWILLNLGGFFINKSFLFIDQAFHRRLSDWFRRSSLRSTFWLYRGCLNINFYWSWFDFSFLWSRFNRRFRWRLINLCLGFVNLNFFWGLLSFYLRSCIYF